MADDTHAHAPADPTPAKAKEKKNWFSRNWEESLKKGFVGVRFLAAAVLGAFIFSLFSCESPPPPPQTAAAPAPPPAPVAAPKPDTALSEAIGREVGRAIQGSEARVQAQLAERDARHQREIVDLQQRQSQAAPALAQPLPAPQATPAPPAAGQQVPGATQQRQARVSPDRTLKVYIQTILDDALGDD